MGNEIENASDRLSVALEAQTDSINALAGAIRGQRKQSRLILGLVCLNIVGVMGAGITIVQNNSAAKERAEVAVIQRNSQLDILRRLDQAIPR